MPDTQWMDIGSVETLREKPLQVVSSGKTTIALTYKDGSFAAISGICNHVGGPLGEGTLDGDYVVRHEEEEAAAQASSACAPGVAPGRSDPRRGDLDDGDDHGTSTVQHLRRDVGCGAGACSKHAEAGDAMH